MQLYNSSCTDVWRDWHEMEEDLAANQTWLVPGPSTPPVLITCKWSKQVTKTGGLEGLGMRLNQMWASKWGVYSSIYTDRKCTTQAATICLKLQFGQCNNERLTAVQSPASAANSDQTQITRSSHCGRAPSGTDSIERPDFELFRSE